MDGGTTGDGGTAGNGEPVAGIRASDAERDATVDRLSAATGDGRLTLEEFNQRMDRATTAKTRAELDRLVADLPTDASAAGTAVAVGGPDKPSWHISPIGGFSVSGPWRMARHVIVISLIGGAHLDLSQAQLAAREVTLTKVSLVGGVTIDVPPAIRVDASGFSLIGGTTVDAGPEPGPGAPTVHIRAFSLLGGTRIYRGGPAGQPTSAGQTAPVGQPAPTGQSQMDWRSQRRAERYQWRAQRRAERRSRRYR
ncbi:MAG TPA: DUF1707 domain-containing protein [Streptosporangiaceae bacterium]|nr:DUF1707 domain-containing protein [Streptosporangiaceae bacterium]